MARRMTAEEREEYWANEEILSVHPDPTKVHCKDCIYRRKDIMHGDVVINDGATNGYCEVYQNVPKPIDILFDGKKCRYHTTAAELEERENEK